MDNHNKLLKNAETRKQDVAEKDDDLQLMRRLNRDPRFQNKVAELVRERKEIFIEAGIRDCPGLQRGKTILEQAAEELAQEDEMNAERRENG